MLDERAISLPPYMRCDCGKIHTRAFISTLSVCTCGRRLWDIMWR